MSRMATMQVLNDAFRTANQAFDAYTRNKNDERRMELTNEMAKLDREYRAQQAAQAQANLDRAFQQGVNLANQAQANADRNYARDVEKDAWLRENAAKIFDYRAQQDAQAENRANLNATMNILKSAPDAATANAWINEFGAGWKDPMLQRAFVADYYKQKKLQDLNAQYDGYLKYISQIDAARQRAELAQEKQNAIANNNALKLAVPFVQASLQNKTNPTPEDMAQAVDEFNALRALLSGNSNITPANYEGLRVPIMTPEQALQAYKEGRMSKEQLADFRKNFR